MSHNTTACMCWSQGDTPFEDIPARIASLKNFDKPIVCNEDEKTGMEGTRAAELCVANGASWGLMLVAVTAGLPRAGYTRERHGSCRPRTVTESPLGRRGSRRQFGSFEQEEPTAVFFLARPEQLPALFTEGVQQV